MCDELLQLMMKFRLCYEIPTSKNTYIAPQLLFDGDHKKQQLTEQAYGEAFRAADEAYAKYLSLLIAEAKKN